MVWVVVLMKWMWDMECYFLLCIGLYFYWRYFVKYLRKFLGIFINFGFFFKSIVVEIFNVLIILFGMLLLVIFIIMSLIWYCIKILVM